MMPFDHPLCACLPDHEPVPLIQFSDRQRPSMATSQQAIQDVLDPNSFFRLSREIRNKVYFLSSRPDCNYSLNATNECDKMHVHQSATGRQNAWKWLALCQQSWSEAVEYMPIMRLNVRFIAGDNVCHHCWNLSHQPHGGTCLSML